MSTDLDAALRSTDPLAGKTDPAPLSSLRAARMDVDRRRRQAPRPRWRRPLVLGAAVAATAAVTILVIDPGQGAPGQPGNGGGLLPAAVAANGEIEPGGDAMSSGYARAVAPHDADLRLLPSALPRGWSYESISARVQTEGNWDVPPSLVAISTDPGGNLTASLSVLGPVEATVDEEGTDADVVDGHDARLFILDRDAGDTKPATRIWWWTDTAGKQWQARTTGLFPDDAHRAVQGLRTSGDQLTWQGATDPDLDLVHQRRGPAYPTERSALSWDLVLNDGHRERTISITRQDTPEPLSVLAQRADTDLQVTTINDRPAIVWPLGQTESGAPETPIPGAPACRWEDYQVSAAVSAHLQACGDQDQVTALLASLVNVPPSDPRLSTYASDE